MDLQTYITKKRGRQAEIARKLGLSASYMSQIVKGIRPLPIEFAASLEIATEREVTRKDLYPNTWQSIWPELSND